MLRLILGRAGSGKTAAVMEEIRDAVREHRGGRILLVPEQYSHEAERELCAVCGDSLSLYGEVFSFSGMARRGRDLAGQGRASAVHVAGAPSGGAASAHLRRLAAQAGAPGHAARGAG